VELVMVCRSLSRPASGRFAVNQWTQLTLTRRVALASWGRSARCLTRGMGGDADTDRNRGLRRG